MGDAPLMVDLFCGLGGWAEGGLAEGYRVVGFDIERHVYGDHKYPGMLAIQDVRTLHGSQFRDAALLIASPPCQEFSYMAMPWSLGKAKAAAIRADETGRATAKLTELFDTCFRIQREACEAAGRHIPLIVENVKGAQPWVGRARWAFGSFFLWGDVPALMPIQRYHQRLKVRSGEQWNVNRSNFTGTLGWDDGFKSSGIDWSDQTKRGQYFTRIVGIQAMEDVKTPGMKHGVFGPGGFQQLHVDGIKHSASGEAWFDTGPAPLSSKSVSRKAASAMIAKIPLVLARHIAATYRP